MVIFYHLLPCNGGFFHTGEIHFCRENSSDTPQYKYVSYTSEYILPRYIPIGELNIVPPCKHNLLTTFIFHQSHIDEFTFMFLHQATIVICLYSIYCQKYISKGSQLSPLHQDVARQHLMSLFIDEYLKPLLNDINLTFTKPYISCVRKLLLQVYHMTLSW